MKSFRIAAMSAALLVGSVAAATFPARASAAVTGNASASSESMGGLGFHVSSSPFSGINLSSAPTATPTLGLRQWFSEKAAIDLGLGYNVFNSTQGTQKETWTGFALDGGLPLVLKEWDHVNFIFRPGVQFAKLKDEDKTVAPTVTTQWTTLTVSGDLEVEWMVANKVSLSAAHGIGWSSLKDDSNPTVQKFTSFGTTGSNFTQLGFHVYLW